MSESKLRTKAEGWKSDRQGRAMKAGSPIKSHMRGRACPFSEMPIATNTANIIICCH